jgi:hypothetical protein
MENKRLCHQVNSYIGRGRPLDLENSPNNLYPYENMASGA